ncbi:hypothetical protein [Arenibacter troitsensis]|uniref:hypothetical protein n=1 Tax=Arenibacter troitsensis TaxID=188872 RepID=UPI000A1C9CCD|nr:hypothetical protein [Arenibacter troitsensis]
MLHTYKVKKTLQDWNQADKKLKKVAPHTRQGGVESFPTTGREEDGAGRKPVTIKVCTIGHITTVKGCALPLPPSRQKDRDATFPCIPLGSPARFSKP